MTARLIIRTLLLAQVLLFSCKKESISNAYQVTRSITYNGVSVQVVIDKPNGNAFDVLVLYHGTVQSDNNILQAARNILNKFKEILDRDNLLIVSVAYPQQNLLFGDNILQAEAALLWVQNLASQELEIEVGKVFIAGHSQGGYLVTRLNTMHQTNGVISNAPGPLNLVFRCQLEEDGQISPAGNICALLSAEYGSTTENPDAYMQRSLLSFTDGFKSDILFVQGLNDGPIQMYSWPVFKQQLQQCSDCQEIIFLDIPNYGHAALFESPVARSEFNKFISSRL
jgi:poly(3-hydroxybutyrate) depolymerase